MDAKARRQKRREDDAISSLNTAIDAINLAKEALSMTPATVAFGSASILLTMIRVRFLFFGGPPHTHVQPGLHGQ